MELGDRKKKILNLIVERYICTGEPVGSKYIAGLPGMGISSATIRNEMSELVEMGCLEQPHTSAGRIPTQLGYRVYVDRLMERYRLTPDDRVRIDKLLSIDGGDIESTVAMAGEMLAELTGCAAVSTAPEDLDSSVRSIEILPAGRRSMLFVILTSSGVIKSRLCRIEDDITPEMLSFFSQLLNDSFCGKKIEVITPDFVKSITSKLFEYTYALSPVVELIAHEISSVSDEVFLGGTENLLVSKELHGSNVADIIKSIERRDEFLKLIGGINDGVKVSIGIESGRPYMEEASVVAAPYIFQGKVCGAVGIIGPKRMNYAWMMSNIEYFSAVLSRLINYNFGD